MEWRKSSRSFAGGECIEVAMEWRKSTRSANTSDCVEVARLADLIYVRDTKDRAGGTLRFDRAAWLAFLEQVKQS
jgi:hypothetical protein